MGLIQAELERRGIRTASITMLPEITRAVRPPRALSVPFPLGYPLGRPDDPALQHAILLALMGLLTEQAYPVIVPLPGGHSEASEALAQQEGPVLGL